MGRRARSRRHEARGDGDYDEHYSRKEQKQDRKERRQAGREAARNEKLGGRRKRSARLRGRADEAINQVAREKLRIGNDYLQQLEDLQDEYDRMDAEGKFKGKEGREMRREYRQKIRTLRMTLREHVDEDLDALEDAARWERETLLNELDVDDPDADGVRGLTEDRPLAIPHQPPADVTVDRTGDKPKNDLEPTDPTASEIKALKDQIAQLQDDLAAARGGGGGGGGDRPPTGPPESTGGRMPVDPEVVTGNNPEVIQENQEISEQIQTNLKAYMEKHNLDRQKYAAGLGALTFGPELTEMDTTDVSLRGLEDDLEASVTNDSRADVIRKANELQTEINEAYKKLDIYKAVYDKAVPIEDARTTYITEVFGADPDTFIAQVEAQLPAILGLERGFFRASFEEITDKVDAFNGLTAVPDQSPALDTLQATIDSNKAEVAEVKKVIQEFYGSGPKTFELADRTLTVGNILEHSEMLKQTGTYLQQDGLQLKTESDATPDPWSLDNLSGDGGGIFSKISNGFTTGLDNFYHARILGMGRPPEIDLTAESGAVSATSAALQQAWSDFDAATSSADRVAALKDIRSKTFDFYEAQSALDAKIKEGYEQLNAYLAKTSKGESYVGRLVSAFGDPDHILSDEWVQEADSAPGRSWRYLRQYAAGLGTMGEGVVKWAAGCAASPVRFIVETLPEGVSYAWPFGANWEAWEDFKNENLINGVREITDKNTLLATVLTVGVDIPRGIAGLPTLLYPEDWPLGKRIRNSFYAHNNATAALGALWKGGGEFFTVDPAESGFSGTTLGEVVGMGATVAAPAASAPGVSKLAGQLRNPAETARKMKESTVAFAQRGGRGVRQLSRRAWDLGARGVDRFRKNPKTATEAAFIGPTRVGSRVPGAPGEAFTTRSSVEALIQAGETEAALSTARAVATRSSDELKAIAARDGIPAEQVSKIEASAKALDDLLDGTPTAQELVTALETQSASLQEISLLIDSLAPASNRVVSVAGFESDVATARAVIDGLKAAGKDDLALATAEAFAKRAKADFETLAGRAATGSSEATVLKMPIQALDDVLVNPNLDDIMAALESEATALRPVSTMLDALTANPGRVTTMASIDAEVLALRPAVQRFLEMGDEAAALDTVNAVANKLVDDWRMVHERIPNATKNPRAVDFKANVDELESLIAQNPNVDELLSAIESTNDGLRGNALLLDQLASLNLPTRPPSIAAFEFDVLMARRAIEALGDDAAALATAKTVAEKAVRDLNTLAKRAPDGSGEATILKWSAEEILAVVENKSHTVDELLTILEAEAAELRPVMAQLDAVTAGEVAEVGLIDFAGISGPALTTTPMTPPGMGQRLRTVGYGVAGTGAGMAGMESATGLHNERPGHGNNAPTLSPANAPLPVPPGTTPTVTLPGPINLGGTRQDLPPTLQ